MLKYVHKLSVRTVFVILFRTIYFVFVSLSKYVQLYKRINSEYDIKRDQLNAHKAYFII